MEGVGLIETFRVGSVVDKSNKYMCVTFYDIKRIKHHSDASCNLMYECKRNWASKSAFTVVFRSDGRGWGTSLCLGLVLHGI